MVDPVAAVTALQEAPREVMLYLDDHQWWIAAAAAFAGAMWAAAAGWWRRRAAAVLQDRVAFDLLPAASFEPGAPEIRWFAGQLASVPAAGGALPRRAMAARVRITCRDNQVRYVLEGPGRARSLLMMPGYQDVEVLPAGGPGDRPVVPIRFDNAPPVTAAGAS